LLCVDQGQCTICGTTGDGRMAELSCP
jgi:hypothetical protein